MKLAPISRSDLIKRLRAFGWSGPLSKSRHQYMEKGPLVLILPNPHGSKELGVDLLKRVLDQAGITREEWLAAR